MDKKNKLIEKRKAVWQAISLFYLDTELQKSDYDFIIKTFQDSKLSLSELKKIDQFEVFPSLQFNLLNVVGIWDSFDEKWLIQKCFNNYSKKEKLIFQLRVEWMNKLFYSMRSNHWEEIMKRNQLGINQI